MVTNYLTLNKIEDTKGFLILVHNCDGELQMLLLHQEVFFKNHNYLLMNALFVEKILQDIRLQRTKVIKETYSKDSRPFILGLIYSLSFILILEYFDYSNLPTTIHQNN